MWRGQALHPPKPTPSWHLWVFLILHLTNYSRLHYVLCSYILFNVSSIHIKERNTLFWTPRFSLQYSQSVDAFNSSCPTLQSIPTLSKLSLFLHQIKSNQTFVPTLMTWPDELCQGSRYEMGAGMKYVAKRDLMFQQNPTLHHHKEGNSFSQSLSN